MSIASWLNACCRARYFSRHDDVAAVHRSYFGEVRQLPLARASGSIQRIGKFPIRHVSDIFLKPNKKRHIDDECISLA